MYTIYVGDVTEHEDVSAALRDGGMTVIEEKCPLEAGPDDLVLVKAQEAVTSQLRHAINNPLTAVLGYAQLLLRRDDLPEDILDKLDKIHEHAKRVRDLVRGKGGYV